MDRAQGTVAAWSSLGGLGNLRPADVEEFPAGVFSRRTDPCRVCGFSTAGGSAVNCGTFYAMIGEKVRMSERSIKLARLIRRARGCQPEAKQESHDQLLDRGFGFLKIDIEREFHNQISDLNNEPGCKGTLGCEFSGSKSRVFKIGEEYRGLVINFNPGERTAEIKGHEPIKFHYSIHVKLGPDETKWGYRVAKRMESLCPSTASLTALSKGHYLPCSESKLSIRSRRQVALASSKACRHSCEVESYLKSESSLLANTNFRLGTSR
jgi:hypothetical protein